MTNLITSILVRVLTPNKTVMRTNAIESGSYKSTSPPERMPTRSMVDGNHQAYNRPITGFSIVRSGRPILQYRNDIAQHLAQEIGNRSFQRSLMIVTPYLPVTKSNVHTAHISLKPNEQTDSTLRMIEEHLHRCQIDVNMSVISMLPTSELQRLKQLCGDGNTQEVIRRLGSYGHALDFSARVSSLSETRIRETRKKIAKERKLGNPDSMRATQGGLVPLQHKEFLIHAFGAASAYDIHPHLLIAIFFQEGGHGFFREGGRRLLADRQIDSYNEYGLDNAYSLRGERSRHPEFQLGALEKREAENENRKRVVAAKINGIRDLLYYTAADLKRYQDKVTEDFLDLKLGQPDRDTLWTWTLIYWNGGKGGGRRRLKLAARRGDVVIILTNQKKVGQRPYLYSNRVMGTIQTINRLLPAGE